MKILLIGDLHGRKPLIRFKEFDCIVQIGDVCDDRGFRPYYKKWFRNLQKGNSSESVDQLMLKDIDREGIKKLENESLKKGREILKYLASFGKPVIFIPGNWDLSYGKSSVKNPDKDIYNSLKYFYESYLAKNSNLKLVGSIKNIYDCQYKLHEVEGVNFIGYGLTSGTDHFSRVKGKVSKKQFLNLKKMYSTIENILFNLFKKRNKKNLTIYLSHNVPYGILDKIKDKNNVNNGKHMGSQLSKKICLVFKPTLCLAGHMHENPGKTKLGSTLVINPGYGKNAQVLVEIDKNKRKVRKIRFYKP